jgi:hypothetical protein|tara:strand:- start:152 stop:343 length:192 start_codon:yes stop_codon:yes gene_type:complete
MENILNNKTYLFILDFDDGKCYRYNYNSSMGKIEDFIEQAGHRLMFVEYMLTEKPIVMYGNYE